MNYRSASLGDAFNAGWLAFTKYPWLAMGGLVIYYVISFVAGMIPFIGSLLSIFVVLPLAGGLYILFLNIAKDSNPTLNDLFAGFRSYWTWVGLMLLLGLIGTLCMLPAIIIWIVFAVLAGQSQSAMYGQMPGGMSGTLPGGMPGSAAAGVNVGLLSAAVVVTVVCVIVTIVVTIRYMFAYFLAAEGSGIMDSLRASAEMTQGQRFTLFLIGIVLWLFAMIGVIGLGIGVIFTATVSFCAFAALYLQIRPPPAAEPAQLEPSPTIP